MPNWTVDARSLERRENELVKVTYFARFGYSGGHSIFWCFEIWTLELELWKSNSESRTWKVELGKSTSETRTLKLELSSSLSAIKAFWQMNQQMTYLEANRWAITRRHLASGFDSLMWWFNVIAWYDSMWWFDIMFWCDSSCVRCDCLMRCEGRRQSLVTNVTGRYDSDTTLLFN